MRIQAVHPRGPRRSVSLISFAAMVLILISVGRAIAQHPAVSVGSQILSISYDDCLARAKQALDREGYATARGGGNFYWGGKGIHHASIVCDGSPDNRADVHVFVASNTTDGNVAGAERVRLQERMAKPVSDGTGGGGVAEPVTWRTNARAWRGRNGERFTVNCPVGQPSADLWGTDLYTDDTSICTAAAHSGLITPGQGGLVTIEMRAGASSYQGSLRNGLKSNPYGSWNGSFVFVGGNSSGGGTEAATTIEWNKQADGWRGQNGKRFTLNCKPGQPTGRLWGTDTYTDDSSICTAAVHAGVITAQTGGIVTIEIRPGEANYVSSTRYGIKSNPYGGWSGSFVFVERRWIE